MTKKCGARLCIPCLARHFFRQTAVLSVTAVLLRKPAPLCENNDSTNALRQIVLDGIVLHARDFLQVKLSPKYCFHKLCFQLPQNATWTDEQRSRL